MVARSLIVSGVWLTGGSQPGLNRDPSLKAINYLDSCLRVETLSFEEAAPACRTGRDFNPQE